jgi:Leucine-rich repeat (LRR) protein
MPRPSKAQAAYAKALQRIEVCHQLGEAGTTLDLTQLGLVTLPPEIVKLTALTELYLWNNKLRTLPPEISKLSALTCLNLATNQLSALPPEIRKLLIRHKERTSSSILS